MKKSLLIICTLLFASNIIGQTCEDYAPYTKEAFSLYKKGKYLQASQKYAEAFQLCGNFGLQYDRYYAACSWSLIGKTDSAFAQLFIIFQDKNIAHIEKVIAASEDLISLHTDKRWHDIIKSIRKRENLIAILDTVHKDDQTYRLQLDTIEEKYGVKSLEAQACWKLISEKDSINLVKVTKILDEYGWLGSDIVGHQGSNTLFLIVQHSDHKTQKKYLSMMKEAVKKGNAEASSFAMLEDRVALGEGKKQIYGSQIGRYDDTEMFYILPLEDPDNVDERRAEVGLSSLKDYVLNFGITWDVDEYKKELPKIETMYRVK